MSLLDRFRDHLDATGLLPPGERILVGYSGGADSTCLLHMLHQLGYDLVAAHLHHGMRAEAELELRLCEGFAAELGVPFISGRADVPKIARDRGMSVEHAGREARYEFFRQAFKQFECRRVVTAHTQTDHAETVLLNLIRGTGLAGLGGIPAERGEIVRPLLRFTRGDMRAYCDSEGLWYHEDPANTDLSNSRTRVRLAVMPELRVINPAVEATIARSAELIAEEDNFLNGAAAAALERAEEPLNGALRFLTHDVEVAFAMRSLGDLPAVLFRRAVRLAVQTIGGSLDHHQTLRIVEGVRQGLSGSITTEGQTVVVQWDDERLHVRAVVQDETYRHSVTFPGETIADVFGWQVTAFPDSEAPATVERADLETSLNSAAVKGNLYFRSIQPGDAMVPLGFDHRRKVSDLVAEAKLTQAARRRIPVICDLVGPVWIPGVCVDARVVDPSPPGPWIRMAFGPIQP